MAEVDLDTRQSGQYANEISARISLLRYLMICGIVFLHSPPYIPIYKLPEVLSWFDWIKEFFSNGFFRATVPVLTSISGYLTFSTTSSGNYHALVRRKAQRLLAPLVIWNLPVLLLLYLLVASGFVASDRMRIAAYPFDIWQWINGIFGVVSNPVNYPLNFLRDLFALALLSPIVGYLVKSNPWLGFVVWSTVFISDLDGWLVLRGDMAVVFYAGALLAFKRFDLRKLDAWWMPLLLLAVLASIALVYYRIENRVLFRVMSPLLIWPASAVLINTAVGRFMIRSSKISFFIFLSHAFLVAIYWSAFRILFPTAPGFIPWALLPVTIIASCHVIYRILSRHTPSFLSFLLGGRES